MLIVYAYNIPIRVQYSNEEEGCQNHASRENGHEVRQFDVSRGVEVQGHDEFVGEEVLIETVGKRLDQSQRSDAYLACHFHQRSRHGRERRNGGEYEVAENAGDEGAEGNVGFGAVEQRQKKIGDNFVHAAGLGGSADGHAADDKEDLRIGDSAETLLVQQGEAGKKG